MRFLSRMTTSSRFINSCAAVLTALSTHAGAAGFADVLETPAQVSPLAAHSLLQAVARAGNRLVAVGQRGHILVSSDAGTTWTQSRVPVSSDLTSVFFVDATEGWAVGHDGVILHSADGGSSWELQLDGVSACERTVSSLERKPGTAKLLDEAQRCRQQGADKPFLDVWFSDSRNGYAVGAYNLLFRTRDGGKTWESWFDRSDNPKFLNLYAIRPAGGVLLVAGEGGLALRFDPASQRFKAVALPYRGSFFGVADAGSTAILFGLRGHAYASDDDARTWKPIDTGLAASIVAAARTDDGRLLLADAGGRVSSSTDGRTFTALALQYPTPIAGLVDAGNGKLVLVGPRGASVAPVLR
jgi:photosystem II stability/assembly factor-like uncharacterized protein